ncbi:MAG: hypothetical protein QM831_30950 [Kofleriaceae bacterium]
MRFAIVLVALWAVNARADVESDFHQAEVAASHGDPHAADQFEAIGAERPVTRWTDDAWIQASRVVERGGDLARAAKDLEAAAAVATDPIVQRRIRGDLERLAKRTGEGKFADVATEHDRLVQRLAVGGDPKPALAELEALLAAHPGYPRAATAMLTIAHGWERDGAFDRASEWISRAAMAATPAEHEHVQAEVARFGIRAGDFDQARDAIGTLEDPELRAALTHKLASARHRHALRVALWIVLAMMAIGVAWRVRKARGRMWLPPAEWVFLLPIAIVIAAVAMTGNPLVARAVRSILIVGLVVTWLSGVVLAVKRPTRVGLAFHVVCVAIAVLGASYLAIDRDRMIDLVVETWRSGPEH